MKPILSGLLLACSAFVSANMPEDFKPLRHQDWPLWAQAQWQYQPQQRVPVYLSVRNRTRLETDEALLTQASSIEDVESGGVPLRYLEHWLRHTLNATGSFTWSSNPEERFRIDVELVDYQPLYTAEGQAGAWRDTKSTVTRWYEQWQDPALRTQVGFHVYWQDRQRGEVRSFSTYVEARACEQFRGAATIPETINAPFAEHFRRSLIGQTSTALMNRIVYWLLEQQPFTERFHPVMAVRGERLEWVIDTPHVKVGDLVDIYHRDDPFRHLGKAQIIRQQDKRIFAQPITMSPGSVTTGDVIKQYSPRTDRLLIPTRLANANRCATPTDSIAPADSATPPEPVAQLDSSIKSAQPDESAGSVSVPESDNGAEPATKPTDTAASDANARQKRAPQPDLPVL